MRSPVAVGAQLLVVSAVARWPLIGPSPNLHGGSDRLTDLLVAVTMQPLGLSTGVATSLAEPVGRARYYLHLRVSCRFPWVP